MNGLPNHHPVLGRNGAIPVAAGQDIDYPAGHTVLGSRHGAAGMGDLLLLQQLRSQQERHAAGGGVRDNTISQAAMMARRDEEELTRLHDGHNRMMEAELASSAMRDRIMAQQQQQQQAQKSQAEDRFRTDSIERFLTLQEQQRQQRELPQGHHHYHHHQQQAAELIDQAAGHVAFGGYAQQQRQQQQLSGVQTHHQLQESLIRRMLLEEEVMKRHFQQQQIHNPSLNGQERQSIMGLLADHSVGAATGRGGVGGDINGASASRIYLHPHVSSASVLPFQKLSDEDLIRRAAEIQSAQNTVLRENLEMNKRAAAAHNQQLMESELLRNNLRFIHPEGLPSVVVASRGSNDIQKIYFDKVDQSHARAAVAQRTSPAQTSNYPTQTNSRNNHLRYFNNGVEVDMNGNPLPSRSNGIDSTNVTANSSSTESAMISQFLTGVVSRVPEIAPAVATLLPDEGGATLLNLEFPNLVNSILGILVSVQERVARTASDDIELDLLMRVTSCMNAIKAYKVDTMNKADGRVPTIVPPAAGVPAGKGLSPTLRPEGMMMMRWDPSSKSSYSLGQIVQPSNPMNYASNTASWPSAASLHGGAFQTSHLPESIEKPSDKIKQDSTDDDDIPIMTMYKAAKRAAKRAKKAEKWKRRPKLVHKVTTASSTGIPHKKSVHHVLQTEEFDANQRITDESPPARHISLSPGEIDSGRDATEKNPIILDTCEEESDVVDDEHENDEAEKCEDKHGPHGDILDRLFGGGTKTKKTDDREEMDKATDLSSNVDGANLAPKPSATGDSLVISPEDSDDNTSTREVSKPSKSDGTDVRYDAASVLLGLMKK